MSDKLQQFLNPDLQALFEDANKLVNSIEIGYKDYSFLIFLYAKGYEGFLKELFFKIGAISEQQYHSDHWRVGKALNPQLEKEFRHTESVYDRIMELCGGEELPEVLWQAWKKGRNQVFHFWPGRNRPLSLMEAKEIIAEIEKAMEQALTECRI